MTIRGINSGIIGVSALFVASVAATQQYSAAHTGRAPPMTPPESNGDEIRISHIMHCGLDESYHPHG